MSRPANYVATALFPGFNQMIHRPTTLNPDCPQFMSDAPTKDPRLIFVVDDNPLLGQVTAQIIETGGFVTRCYTDALEARSAIRNADLLPGVLVTDYDLGPIIGFELIELIRSRDSSVKCLLVSGTVKAEVLERHPTQPDRFLPKPFKADELLACVNALTVR